ncbi:hypothetical protein D3C81_1640990 [compost metagenome]
MTQQKEKSTFEPCNTKFVGDILPNLFDDHIGREGIGTYIDTVGAQKAALKDIFGGFVQLQIARLILPQQIDKTARGSCLVSIDLMDRTDGDAFTALDTCVACLLKVEYLFFDLFHIVLLNVFSLPACFCI